VPTLQLTFSQSQYNWLQHKAAERRISVIDLVLGAVEIFLRSETATDRYARLAWKQAVWRIYQGGNHRPGHSLPGQRLLREQPPNYSTGQNPEIASRLADLRLDLIYHSEALEGSPLTRDQVEEAVRE